MAESYSVKAVLCAEDKNFSSMMKSCSSYADNLKNTLTSGIGYGGDWIQGSLGNRKRTEKLDCWCNKRWREF